MKKIFAYFFVLIAIIVLFSCVQRKAEQGKRALEIHSISIEMDEDTVILDSDYSFDEAICGTKAPRKIIDELQLFDVEYLSTDGKIHKGQILCNKKIAEDIQALFQLMLDSGFMVEKVIPIVKYNWNDSLSMANNNTYSFCYRNVSYSKHARGMAIDINPRFNPVRYKRLKKPNEPLGAILDTCVNGTFYPNHFVVNAFRKRGFRWGHTFSKYYDDHHFEKR